jgi:crossover junction endodeoxyribonuclease RuvC
MPALRVLGIDTSLRSTGLGVVEREGGRMRARAHATLKNPASWPHSQCLARIHQDIRTLIEDHAPDVAAIEGIFHFKNAKTAVVLGQARGVAIAACAAAGIPVYEYSPRRVKQSVCGTGAASKDQVAKMVCGMLGLPSTPPDDETDALAIAVCHLHSLTSIAGLEPKQI